MAQFHCPICGQGFEQRSAYRRHLQTSHPQRASSAADLERALAGIHFPAGRDALADHARRGGHDDVAGILEELPEQRYRDAAEVARAFGELKSHQTKPAHQPSERGGQAALESLSAARVASLFEGLTFPASRDDLLEHAGRRAGEDELTVLRRLPEDRYEDMADIARGFSTAREGDA